MNSLALTWAVQLPSRLQENSYILLPQAIVLPLAAQHERSLVALDLTDGAVLWSCRVPLQGPSLLVHLPEEGLIGVLVFANFILYRPPQHTVIADYVSLPERSNNMPLAVASAGGCVFTAQSRRGEQPQGLRYALVVVQTRGDKWVAESVHYMLGRPKSLTAAHSLLHGPVCAVVCEEPVALLVYFHRNKSTKTVTLPALRHSHGHVERFAPECLIWRGQLLAAYDGQIMNYDLGDLTTPTRSFDILHEALPAQLRTAQNRQRAFVWRLDADRLLFLYCARHLGFLASLDPHSLALLRQGYVSIPDLAVWQHRRSESAFTDEAAYGNAYMQELNLLYRCEPGHEGAETGGTQTTMLFLGKRVRFHHWGNISVWPFVCVCV